MFKRLPVWLSSLCKRGQGIVRPIATLCFEDFFKAGDWGLEGFRTSVAVTRGGRWVRNCVCVRGTPFVTGRAREVLKPGRQYPGYNRIISWCQINVSSFQFNSHTPPYPVGNRQDCGYKETRMYQTVLWKYARLYFILYQQKPRQRKYR